MTSFIDGIEAELTARKLHTVAFEVDRSQLFDALRGMQGDTSALGERLVHCLLSRDVGVFTRAGMGAYGVAVKPAENAKPEPSEALPADVRRLVIAARKVAFEDQGPEALRELDKASEAFAGLVPWDGEPAPFQQEARDAAD